MATDPTDLYPVITQVAAAFAGFGSLASLLSRRRGADDSRIDAFRLWTMLQSSLSATMLGLLPATLAGLSVGEPWVFRGPAIAALAVMLTYVAIGIRRSVQIRHVPGFSKGGTAANSFCLLAGAAGFSLCAFGLPTDRIAGFYLLGLVGLLGSSVVMFSRVIISMLRPHSQT